MPTDDVDQPEPVFDDADPDGEFDRPAGALATKSRAQAASGGSADDDLDGAGDLRRASRARTSAPRERRSGNWLVRFVREVIAEMRKVLWPTRRELVVYTVVVIVFVSVMIALVAGLDYGFARLVLLVFG